MSSTATTPLAPTPYQKAEPARKEIDALQGPTLLEFGSPTCGICHAAEPLITQALAAQPGVRHLRIADGSGQPLGRSFGVKLWPTLVFLHDGHEKGRLVRPRDMAAIRDSLTAIAA